MAETFGKTTKGALFDNRGDYINSCKFTSGSAGKLEKLSIYIAQKDTNTPHIKCAIYDSDYYLLANGATEEKQVGAGQDGWMHFNFPTPPSVDASTVYMLCFWYDAAANCYGDDGAANQTGNQFKIYTDWPETIYAPTMAYELSIYATYAEAPPPPPGKVELDLMEYATDALAQATYPSSSVQDHILDSYSEVNGDGGISLYEHHPSDGVGPSALGQAFTAAKTFKLTQVKFYIRKYASPTGTAYARLYAATGTVGTDAKATGSALASSTGFNVSTLTDSYALITFDFSGDVYELQNGTDYCIVFENPTSGTIDATNKVKPGKDGSSPTHGGNSTLFKDGAWEANNAWDTIFYIYGDNLQCYSESAIKQQGSYSLKGLAVQTDSLNKTLTRTVDPTIDLSGQPRIYLYIRASRTGGNIKIGFHDSGGVTTEVTPNIALTDTWQAVKVDISGAGDGDKDVIDSIIITIVNADESNIFYLDNIYASLKIKTLVQAALISIPSLIVLPTLREILRLTGGC